MARKNPFVAAALALLLFVGFNYPATLSAQAGQAEAPAADAVTAATAEAGPAPVEADPAPVEAPVDAVSSATQPGQAEAPFNPPRFLGKSVPVASHAITGFCSGALFTAAGIVGAIRFLDMESAAHVFRDGAGVENEGDIDGECAAVIRNTWSNGQWLRWLHVGLLSSGEAFYLYDALTGMSMMKPGASPLSPGRLHRAAFFVHAGLMAAEIVLGFLTTDALSRGDHELMIGLDAAHTVIGIAIPALIIGSGIAIEASRPKPGPAKAESP
jgi:hypothetical protein